MNRRWLISIAMFCGACAAGGEPVRQTTAAAPASAAQPAAAQAPAAKPTKPNNDWSSASGLGDMTAPSRPAASSGGTGDASRTPAAGASASVASSGSPRPAAGPQAGPTYPAGAHYTIFCQTFSGPDHTEVSNRLKQVLQANTQLKDWYLVHESLQSTLYHGFYREFDTTVKADPATMADAKRFKQDISLIESIPNPSALNTRLFPRAQMTPLDAPDPDAPPEWDLAKQKGYYSVQVAAYNLPDRKEAAVEAVREARKQGIDAYYFHGKTVSSVCIGLWPSSAVQRPEAIHDVGKQGVDRGADEESDLVYNGSGEALPEAIKNQPGHNGGRMRVVESTSKVLDPKLLATLKAYPAQALNNVDLMIPGTNKPRPAMIVELPHAAESEPTVATDAAPGTAAPANRDLSQRLRGIGR